MPEYALGSFGLKSYSVAPTGLIDFENTRGKFPESFSHRLSQVLATPTLDCLRSSREIQSIIFLVYKAIPLVTSCRF